jgi:hypothetical protein
MKSYFEKRNLHYFTLSPNFEKPVKAVIRHLPPDTPAENLSNRLEDLGFSVINVRQMTNGTARNGQTHAVPLPLFLVILTINITSQEISKLNSLNHIIKVELYRAQTGQKFGNVWANCKQPPGCLWCGGVDLHRECPEKTNTESAQSCCNSPFGEREKLHAASYRGCSHVKEELQKRRAQRAPKEFCWRMFFSKFTSPEESFGAALRQGTQHQQPQAPQTDGKGFRPPCSSSGHKRKFRKQVCQYRLPVRLIMAC